MGALIGVGNALNEEELKQVSSRLRNSCTPGHTGHWPGHSGHTRWVRRKAEALPGITGSEPGHTGQIYCRKHVCTVIPAICLVIPAIQKQQV